MILQGLCDTYKRELLAGVHRADDEYRMALFTSEADLDHRTTRYTRRGEVVGEGYDAGGLSLRGCTVGLEGRTAYLTFADPEWPIGSITARGALIYNASREQRAVAVLDFGEDRSSDRALFRVALPPATASEALIRI